MILLFSYFKTACIFGLGLADGWLTEWAEGKSVPECDNYEEDWSKILLSCPARSGKRRHVLNSESAQLSAFFAVLEQ